MNIGIVTLYGLNNYGNRLQNYAVHSMFTKLGLASETLVPQDWAKTAYRKRIEKTIYELFQKDPLAAQEQSPLVVRQLRFEQFDNDNIPQRFLDKYRYDEALAKEYDFFATGSDQVWNPSFRGSLGQLENYLLAFAKPSQRVCASPSIGMDELDPKWHSLYRREWNKFPYLNVREQSGADLIKQLTGRNAEVVLDPTLMIERAEWESLAQPLLDFDEDSPFILYYFLGSEEEEVSPEMRAVLDRQVERGMKEYRLFCKDDPVTRTVGPAEFLYLFQRASLVCTDSFHATVFSILMGKPFLLCDRQLTIADKVIDMSNRTKTLLGALELTHRLPQNQELSEEAVFTVDYTQTYRIIQAERERMQLLLKKTLRME